MSWRQEALKGVLRLRYARGSCQKNFDPGIPELACTEFIGACGERGQLKHLSSRRKRKKTRFPQ